MIHKAGWVHRDLSVGNLYLYVDPVSGEKRGLIGDFECAKKVGSGGRYDLGMVILPQNFRDCDLRFSLGYSQFHVSRNFSRIISIRERRTPFEN